LCLLHIRRERTAVLVHCRSDIGMAHEPLLHANRRTDGIQPGPVRMPKSVCSKIADPGYRRCPLQFTPESRIRIRKLAKLQRTGEDPIISSRKRRDLTPLFQNTEQLRGELSFPYKNVGSNFSVGS